MDVITLDLHRLAPQLQDCALLKHIPSGDLFCRKTKFLERCQSSPNVFECWMDQDIEVAGEPRRAVESHRVAAHD